MHREMPMLSPAEVSSGTNGGGYVIFIGNSSWGGLGRDLIARFLKRAYEEENLPEFVILWGNGTKILEDRAVADILLKISQMGSGVLIGYEGIGEGQQPPVGKVVTAETIFEIIENSPNVVWVY